MLQLFALFLLLDWTGYREETLYIGLLDYEKAFDFVNRYRLINDLVDNGADRDLVKNIFNMYSETFYVPKINDNRLGDEIRTMYGVTQGKTSSCDIFSFHNSDMPLCFKTILRAMSICYNWQMTLSHRLGHWILLPINLNVYLTIRIRNTLK